MNNFDFFVGTWTSTQRRLRKILAGSDDWYEFPGNVRCWNVMGGAANVDEIEFPDQGTSGMTLRLYDPATELWSLYWATTRTGLVLPPMVGRFGDDGRGVFSGDDVHDGTPIRCNYIWSAITPESARWEQEFSADGGRTWETNWVMDFTRAG
ncbi:hypothetical protein ACFO1B_33605 [Dactylosporangium siamense]|uniref:DUF1579 domain-containing protein n=1 Tax=Dactylosporangium siamense TaxID=685454 RepID=A0A919PHS0_9ACTN|nr:hypothetical protein [Dactylosporangium siamense]GIG42458.1 hypothetical protein Dsi01nite_004990 [Dactylosporangium siamense]